MTRNVKFVVVPGSILRDRKLTASSKLVFGMLRFYQGNRGSCWPGLARLAADLHVDRSTVKRSIARLEAADLVTVHRRHRRSSLYRVDDRVDDDFLLISDAALAASITPAAKLLFSYLNFKMGDNGQAWPHQKTIAADLGLSKATVCRTIAELEKTHALQVQHAHGGIKQGNRYQTTLRLFKGAKCSASLKSGASKCPPNHNTHKELKRKPRKKISQRRLSPPADLAYRRLTWAGVHPKVARSIVYDQLHSPESIDASIANAKTREVSVRAQHKAFSVPGYIVATLNKAHKEVHQVKPSPATRRVQELAENIKNSRWDGRSDVETPGKVAAMVAALYQSECKFGQTG